MKAVMTRYLMCPATGIVDTEDSLLKEVRDKPLLGKLIPVAGIIKVDEAGIKERFKCRTAIVDGNGGAWIEGPMPGRWLDQADTVKFLEWRLYGNLVASVEMKRRGVRFLPTQVVRRCMRQNRYKSSARRDAGRGSA